MWPANMSLLMPNITIITASVHLMNIQNPPPRKNTNIPFRATTTLNIVPLAVTWHKLPCTSLS